MEKFDHFLYRDRLISWGIAHFRSFPWRLTRDPYSLLIAELLLHRTRANQVVDVYLVFIEHFPDLNKLNMANNREISEILKPLGLNWRVRLIKQMADEIIQRFDGQIPVEYDELISLPGVGDYIARSLRCFSYGIPVAIIDINVMRVITRLLEIPFRDSLRRNRKFQQLAEDLVDQEKPRGYNYAILDLSNQICRPKNPLCLDCPLQGMCLWCKSHFQSENSP